MVHKRSLFDYIFDTFIILVLVLLLASILYPFINALAISFNHADDTARGGITFYPRQFSWVSYRSIVTNPMIWNAYFITLYRTIVGVVTALFCTSLLAYGLTHNKLIGRKFYTIVCLVPMYFSGGLIPYFLMIRAMGMMNHPAVYIVPSFIGLFNVILMRTYFQSIPDAIEEAARIDGANYIQIYFRIILPISTPIIATICLFIGVWHWNDWFIGTIFVTTQTLKPMQNVLLSVISEARFLEQMAALVQQGVTGAARAGFGRSTNVRSITMATMFVTIFPVVIVYPFLQRYFIKGIMIGSIKG